MPSAAMAGLYPDTATTARTSMAHRWLDTSLAYRYLNNTEIKHLCLILSNYPQPNWDPSEITARLMAMERQILTLPRNLRSRRISLAQWILPTPESGKLCTEHKGLNVHVVASVWGVLRHEIERGVGKFLWPIIMEIGLPSAQELKMRQLEPVLELFQDHFNIFEHTPPGREPIQPTVTDSLGRKVKKWRFQENGCTACMLARIGSDKDVLFALLAGMVGRHRSRVVGPRNNIKSVRIRFVKYWLKNLCGPDLCDDAFDLGIELRRLSNEYKWQRGEDKRSKGFYGKVRDEDEPIFRAKAPRSDTSSAIGIDISGDYHPGFRQAQRPAPPRPERPVSMLPESPLGAYGYQRPSPSSSTIRPVEIPRKPLAIPSVQDTRRTDNIRHSGQPSIHSNRASIATCPASVLSWESNNHSLRPMSQLSAIPRSLNPHRESARVTPRPSCRSMYAASVEDKNDEGVDNAFDVSPPDSPTLTPLASLSSGDRYEISPPDTPRAGFLEPGQQSLAEARRDWERRSNFTNDY